MPDYVISARITGDAKSFESAVGSAEKTVKNFESRMKSVSDMAASVGKKMSTAGTYLTVGVTTPLAIAGKSVVTAASDFDENMNKISVAFGDNAAEVKAWADTATESFGLSMNQALEATALFGDMATSMGISRGEAADMSTSLAGLAGDMASFKNIGIDQAMTALNGVFTGETESLKQLGIVMTETNLQEYADGLGLVYSSMTQAEKVQLRYNYVMEMSKNAIGDYSRTSDGTANSMRTFQASVDNLSIALGQNLLPIVTPLIQKATDMVNAFANADPEIQQLVIKIAMIAAAVGPALLVVGKLSTGIGGISKAIGLVSGASSKLGGLGSIFTTISGPAGIAMIAIGALAAAFGYLMTTNDGFRESIMGTVAQIGSSLAPVITSLLPVITKLATVIASTLGMALQALAPVIVQIVTVVGQLIATIAPLIAQLITSLAPIITTIIETVSSLIAAVFPPLIEIIQAIMSAIQPFIPVITSILSTVISVVSSIISTISPIVEFIAGIISKVIGVISPIVSVVSSVFSTIFSIVSSIMSSVGSFISGVFSGISDAWNGLTSFVGGVFDAISGAVKSLVDKVKGVVNTVIKGINGAIWIINLIPGVNISPIKYLLHGTDNWPGGFAVMNEGGRGELTYLPNGSQVIPHDLSVKYTKEAARQNAQGRDWNPGAFEAMLANALNNLARRPVYTTLRVGSKDLANAIASYVTHAQQREVRIQSMVRGERA